MIFADYEKSEFYIVSIGTEGLACIEAKVSISYLERLFMKDVAEENRARGISLANDICKNYRRKGLFFDEILDEAKIGGKE